MTKEQLLRKLKINGKPVKVVAGQLVIPESMQKKEEEKTSEEAERNGPTATC